MQILQLVFIQIITFVLLIAVLRWLLYRHIARSLRRLKQLNQQNLEKERTLREELQRAKREAEREIQEGRAQAEQIKEQARRQAEKEREEIFAQARKEAKRIIVEAERENQKKRLELTLNMQERSVYLATQMIRYIFGEKGKEQLHAQLIGELIEEVGSLDSKNIKKQSMDISAINRAEVITAFSLEHRQKEKLTKYLSDKLDRNISLNETIDPEIIAGLVIKMGRFVIDGSIKNKLKKILPLLKEEAKA